ncbi:MAG: hypothetical protein RI935_764 [Candidatus Parcubacteria bacterium]|jgi:hypothetical protein
MNQEKVTGQAGLEGEGFQITPEIILKNKEMVVDFFGDRRDIYALLKRPGTTRPSVSLETQEALPHDEDKHKDESDQRPMPIDQLPLDPNRITEQRAEHIALFFRESPRLLAEFLEYQTWYDSRV